MSIKRSGLIAMLYVGALIAAPGAAVSHTGIAWARMASRMTISHRSWHGVRPHDDTPSVAGVPGAWVTVASLPAPAQRLAAARDSNGQIVAMGGCCGASGATAESYIPKSNTWLGIASMHASRVGLGAAQGSDGRVYAVGGLTRTVEAYDPAAKTWQLVASLPVSLTSAGVAQGDDGRIYALGGDNASTAARAYDAGSNAWSSVAPLPTGRYGLAAALAYDGRLYAVGGFDGGGHAVNTVEAYNSTSGTWSAVANLPTPRGALAAAEGADGRVYALGGQTPALTGAVEAYDPASNIWSALPPLPVPVYEAAATTDSKGRIYVIGGNAGASGATATVQMYTPTTLRVCRDQLACYYHGLQSALTAALPGDTIVVSPGTYTPTATLVISRNVAIEGATGNPSDVMINGSATGGPIMQVASGVSVTISGVMLTGGTAGALRNSGTTAIINSAISDNSSGASGTGGGLTNNGGSLSLSNVTVANNNVTVADDSGPAAGGGVYNDHGVVAISNSAFSGNSAAQSQGCFNVAAGGALYNAGGTVTANTSTFSGNSATASANSSFGGCDGIPADGGAFYDAAPGGLTITNSTITNNSAHGADANSGGYSCEGSPGGSGNGGALYSESNTTVALQGSTVSGNNATGGALAICNDYAAQGGAPAYGGALYTSGLLSVVTSTISGNGAAGDGGQAAGGGGIEAPAGAVTVLSSTIAGNTAKGGDDNAYCLCGGGPANGGGIDAAGPLTLSASTVTGNNTSAGAGGYSDSDEFATSGGTAHGGGVNAGGPLMIGNSTITGNSARGGVGVNSPYGNTVGGDAYGGGVANGVAGAIVNGTITGNSATGGLNGDGSGSGVSGGGGIDGASAVTLTNTIIAGNTAGGNCDGAIGDSGYNLQFGDASCGAGIRQADPRLGALANNGGPTQTEALGLGSAAIGQGSAAACQAPPVNGVDQRGVARPTGGCDIGAYDTETGTTLPALVLSRGSGRYKDTVVMTGTNFGSDESVNIYLDGAGSAPLTSTTSSAGGGFAVTFITPQAISGTHSLIALGQSSGLSATVPFIILPGAYLEHYQGYKGTQDVLKGAGFAPYEVVKGYWNDLNGTPFTVTATTNSVGTFGGSSSHQGITFTVPLSPTGTYRVYAVGQSSGGIAGSTFTLKPHVQVTPSSGRAGTQVKVGGTGYGARETVTIKYNCGTPGCSSTTVLATPTSDANGSFSVMVTIPSNTSVGAHAIGATGTSSGVFAATTFSVTP